MSLFFIGIKFTAFNGMYSHLLFGEWLMTTKNYPKALHMYELRYEDDTVRTVYACGMTHAYSISKECWPKDKIDEVIELDDSWKN